MNPGRRKRLVIAIGAVIAVAVVVVAVWPREKEPEYRGKKLSEWVHHFEGPQSVTRKGEPFWVGEGARAVREVGTDAIPCFLRWMRYERPAWKKRICRVYVGLPKGIKSSRLEAWLQRDRKTELAEAAVAGFSVLSQRADEAVPELISMLGEGTGPETKCRAMESLLWMRPASLSAVPYLEKLTNKPPTYIANQATWVLEAMQSGGEVHVYRN